MAAAAAAATYGSPVVDVRNITDDEFPAYVEAVASGFLRVARPDEVDRYRPRIDAARTFGAFDDDRLVGTATSVPTELTLPGGTIVQVAGVTNVSVTATHRRRGLLTEMMGRQLATITEPVAILIASEAPIYGRFGYGPATEHVTLAVDATMADFVMPPPVASVTRCTATELHAAGPDVYDRFRRAQPGSIERDAWWWDAHLVNREPRDARPPGEEFFVVHRDEAGVAQGFATYRIQDDWDHRVPRSVLHVDDLCAVTESAYRALWQHCIGVDWVKRVEASDRPPVESLPWLLADRRAARQEARADFVWVRLMDVAVALGARRYRVADRIVLDVTGAAPGRFVVDGGPDGASCSPTTSSPDLTVDSADLGAAYLGGTPLWPVVATGRVVAHRPGAVAAFDRMFVTDISPWCCTWF